MISAGATWYKSNRAIQLAVGDTSVTGFSDGSDYPNDSMTLKILCATVG